MRLHKAGLGWSITQMEYTDEHAIYIEIAHNLYSQTKTNQAIICSLRNVQT